MQLLKKWRWPEGSKKEAEKQKVKCKQGMKSEGGEQSKRAMETLRLLVFQDLLFSAGSSATASLIVSYLALTH